MVEAVKDDPIETLTAAQLGFSPDKVGLGGSPTWVSSIYSVKPEREPHIIHVDGDPSDAARELVARLVERGLFGTWEDAASESAPASAVASTADRAIWAVCDVEDGKLREISLELLGGAVEAAAQVGGQVGAVLLGHDATDQALLLTAHGADVVYLADSPRLAQLDPELYTHLLCSAIETYRPWAVLAPASSSGREYAPRVAARLGWVLTGDVVGLEIKDGKLVQLSRPSAGRSSLRSSRRRCPRWRPCVRALSRSVRLISAVSRGWCSSRSTICQSHACGC